MSLFKQLVFKEKYNINMIYALIKINYNFLMYFMCFIRKVRSCPKQSKQMPSLSVQGL